MLLWTSVCKFLCGYLFNSLGNLYVYLWCSTFYSSMNVYWKKLSEIGYIPRSVSATPYDNSVFNCFLKHDFTFLSAKYKRFNFSISSVLTVCLFDIAILVGVKWCLIMVLICIYLMAKDVEYPFIAALLIISNIIHESFFWVQIMETNLQDIMLSEK